MSKLFIFITAIFLSLLFNKAYSQNSQTISNNTYTAPINFGDMGCGYNWVNNNSAIGLPAKGAGNISPFIAINTGTEPITATITATPASPGFAYIPNYQDTTVSVFNTQTNKVIATIPVGPALHGVAVSPDGSMVYVASQANGTVAAINTETNTVVSTIAVNMSPIGAIVSHDGKLVYVACEYGTISVINTATNTLSSSITIPGPYGIAISPDDSKLYVASFGPGNGPGTLSVINTSTGEIITTIPVGPGEISISPDGKFIYVISTLSDYSGTVSVINTITNKIIATVPVGKFPSDISISPDGSKVYVTTSNDASSGIIVVISTKTNSAVNSINISGELTGLSCSPDGSKLYVENAENNTVAVINTTTNEIINTISVGIGPNSSGNFVTAGIGCNIYPITYTITVNPTNPGSIFIPNTFTPNGDGINDTWNIKNLDNYVNCTVAIYTRYGEKIYSSIGYGVSWDGKFRGANLPTGTYYYIIDLKNGSKNLSGSLTIIR